MLQPVCRCAGAGADSTTFTIRKRQRCHAHEIQRYYRNPQVVPYDDLYAVDEPILKVALCDTNGPTKEAYPVMHEALAMPMNC